MKIAVIAANGRSGQAFVKRALAAGHSVNAGIRGNSHLHPHPNLYLINCDATDKTQLKQLIDGQDAVASFLGHVKGSPNDVQTVATKQIVEVMKELGVKRITSLTGTGVRFIGDKITIIDRILNLGITLVDPARVRDGRDHAEVLKSSNLDWTIIRVSKLQDISTRPFSLLEHGPTKIYVSRADVAEAVLQVLEQASFIASAPIIGKKSRY